MKKIVPTIPSGVAGPLGVVHLPRLWLKALLAGTGQLAEGYKDIGPGYDYMVLEASGFRPTKPVVSSTRQRRRILSLKNGLPASPA